MIIIFHEHFKQTDYASDCASVSGRMEYIMEELTSVKYEIITPVPASYEDLSIVHSSEYIADAVKNTALFEMASLSAGGAIMAAQTSLKHGPTFACIRPPGHHAYKNSGWGYCLFSNMAIALLKLKKEGSIKSAFVLDFDAHTGDGTKDVLANWDEVTILNPMAGNNKDYIREIEDCIKKIQYVDIVAVSAGFDSYQKDVGGKLTSFDFYLIGRLMKKFTKRMGHNRRFAILEGGYYLPDLGKNVLSFCHGFEE